MATPVSGNELAPILGVSRSAVRAALKAGRISRLPGGLIDPERARKEWAANTNPARSKVRTSANTSAEVFTQGAQVRTEAEARQAIGLIARILAEEGIPDDGKGMDFGKARTAEMILKARQRVLDQAAQRRTMVDAANANAQFNAMGQEVKTNLIAWPPRVAIEMAEELRVDPATGKVDYRILTVVLGNYVRTLLAEMGEPEAPEWKPAGRTAESRRPA